MKKPIRATRGYEDLWVNILTEKIIYAGANSGMLHAFDAVTGKEERALFLHLLALSFHKL